MKDELQNDQSFQPTLFPYLISAMDQYYGVNNPYEEEYELEWWWPNESAEIQNKKMRILITTFWEYPVIGGLQNYITSLKTGLENLGHSVHVIAPNHFPADEMKALRDSCSEKFTQFFNDRYGSCNRKILHNISKLYSFYMMLKDIDLAEYDIIHAQDRYTANVIGILNQSYQKPLLFTPHGFMTQSRLKFNLMERGSVEEIYFSAIDKQSIKNANQVIVLCDVFRPILINLGAEENKITTVYTGIDFGGGKNQKKSKKSQRNTVITCVSRLRPRKGHGYLFKALALIKDKLKNVEVRIVGDGEMRNTLEMQVSELNLKNVSFLGSREDIPKLLSESDIFVLPTTSDTLPISLIEAMFANQAILTTNCGGIPEIIKDNYSGLIVEPANPKQLAEKLSLLLRKESLRRELAGNAQSFAQQHLTFSNMTQRIEKIYQSFL
ncbi:Glycosyltransferase involved in cell wall bisynthesis [Bacillus sp. OV166]|uniref:glycosyltransferase family 4 protein n=1 Tax=Bacillus sp. OV166 TaxID=1882763 RepID=UPI000A2ADB31|nr:glycosyltransferase family 4 protein [Bacillus sp. OV166]SMQ81767.1 Glycosyltransferase involved in cell wall bisynthesis [Bacillus sp. OV166]